MNRQALMEQLEQAKAFVEQAGYRCAYLAVYGSQNYGLSLDTPEYQSDVDVKCAVFPTLAELAREQSVQPVTLDWRGGQIEIKDVRRIIEPALRVNPSYLEILMTPYFLAPCEAFVRVREQAEELVSRNPDVFMRACQGMGLAKMKNLCHPFPAAMAKIEKYGYDGKQAHHMYRTLLVMRAFAKTGRFVLDAPEEEKPLLLALKRNEFPLETAQAWTQQWAGEMDDLCAGLKAKNTDGELEKKIREMVYRAVEVDVAAQIKGC